jgi:hypothetical protein
MYDLKQSIEYVQKVKTIKLSKDEFLIEQTALNLIFSHGIKLHSCDIIQSISTSIHLKEKFKSI